MNDEWTPMLMYNIIKDKGVYALFFGNMWSVLRYFPIQIFNFMFKENINKSLIKKSSADSNTMKLGKDILGGTMVGALSLAIIYPLDQVDQNNIINFYYNQ